MTAGEYLGKLIEQARQEKNLTRQELADEMDLDVRTVQKLEEEGGNPSYTAVGSYLFLLGISPDIAFSPGLGEDGLKMDHIFRLLLELSPERIRKVCDSACHIRKWKDEHPEIGSLEEYWDFMFSG